MISASLSPLDRHIRAVDQVFARAKPKPDAEFTEGYVYSGIPHPLFNCVYEGQPIEKMIAYFQGKKVPFVWNVTLKSNPLLSNSLKTAGFTPIGILRGLIGDLDKEKIERNTISGYEFRQVKGDEILLFVNLVSSIMKIDGIARAFFEKACIGTASLGFSYWVAIKRAEGKVVSAMSSFIHEGTVSYWNRVTVPEERGKGINHRLAMEAKWDAVHRGKCERVAIFVDGSEAKSINLTQFDLKNEWSYEVFLSPPDLPKRRSAIANLFHNMLF